MVGLTGYDRTRYDRQMRLPDWGEAGQERLKAASVFIAGAGGLGSPVAFYLAAAGIGEIRICDSDRIELSNLNRQILHTDDRIGETKAHSAEETLSMINPKVKITAFAEHLESGNAGRIIGAPSIVVDCLDNYETRYLLNDYCIQQRIPLVHGAIWGLMGQLTFLFPPETPCYKCLVSEPPPKTTFPVLGATPGVVGCLQAMEVLKYLTAIGTNLKGRMLLFDGEEMTFTALTIRRDKSCPACSKLYE
ncbi:MAG: HesA/MoeB/ThiF family protein [Anaerolineales bacterium]